MTGSEAVSDNFFSPYPGPLAIYLHFPFCTNLCSYCDFYKEHFDPADMEQLLRAVNHETEMVLSSFGHEPIEIASVYVGGGTPSLIDPAWLEKWIYLLSTYGYFMPDYEFTIEANPESLTEEFAGKTCEAGVNRIVIGVQSFGVRTLGRLNRRQKTKDIYRAFYLARMAGYVNIAADLIFGLPDQIMKKVRIDLARLMALEPEHISFYQLTVEENTPLAGDIISGKIKLPNEDATAAMYRLGSHILIGRGYRRYEVSNFARNGHRSRHNYAYWKGSPYIGLGPAAHGLVNNHRYGNISDLHRYIDRIEAGTLPVEFVEELTADQSLMETIMLSLRTAEGIDKQQQLLRFGAHALDIFESPAVARYVDSGHLIDETGFLRLTDDGFLLADRIISDLVG